jgi:nucleolar protein 56
LCCPKIKLAFPTVHWRSRSLRYLIKIIDANTKPDISGLVCKVRAAIVVGSFGILAFGEQGELADSALFPRKAQAAAESLLKIEAGKLTKEAADLIASLRGKGYDSFVLENGGLARDVERQLHVEVEVEKPLRVGETVRSDPEKWAIETGFVKDAEGYGLWMHALAMETAKLKVKGAVEKRDLIVSQAIQTLDDLDKIVNLLMSRIREWYGIHFPELDRLVDKHETYIRLVLQLGSRTGFTEDGLEKIDIPSTRAKAISDVAEKSMGANVSDADLYEIQSLCRNVDGLYGLRQEMEGYLDSVMGEVAPNVKTLAGSLLGARLIALAGGLSNLAKKPASTVQVLGAEKALFRSLKTGARPPKHGIIFQHTIVRDAKKWQRGKIARALAGKLAIAARTDAYGARDIGSLLKAGLDKRVGEIHEKYQEPPAAETIVRRERPEREDFGRRGEKRRKRDRERRR